MVESVRGTTPNTPREARLRDPLTWLYPPLEAYDQGRLSVPGGHALFYEQAGNPQGKPVVFLHGGPGASSGAIHRRFFDPERYRVVLFDQRGAGKSTPQASIEANTTWDLVADIERLRVHLGIDRWQVFGGSWGSTLALAYAESHPQSVTELILRGIFLGRPAEIAWVYQAGTVGALYPDGWAHFVAPIPEAERGDLVAAYHRLLTTGTPEARLAAARAWNVWETRLSHLVASTDVIAEAASDKDALSTALLEIHYFRNDCFLRTPTQLLDDVHRIRHIPCIIVQGRYDLVCPLQSAWNLAEAWPEADLQIIGDAGHSAFELGNTRALVAATDRFAHR